MWKIALMNWRDLCAKQHRRTIFFGIDPSACECLSNFSSLVLPYAPIELCWQCKCLLVKNFGSNHPKKSPTDLFLRWFIWWHFTVVVLSTRRIVFSVGAGLLLTDSFRQCIFIAEALFYWIALNCWDLVSWSALTPVNNSFQNNALP